MALTVLIDFPFEIGLGYYAGKWCAYFPPMTLWMWAFVGRLVAACLAHLTVWVFPRDGTVEPWYLLVVIAEHIFSTFTNTIMFVAISAFHAKIADPNIGGTYMTLLATYLPPFPPFPPTLSSFSFKLTQPQSIEPRRNLPPYLRPETRRRTYHRHVQSAPERDICAVLVCPGARTTSMCRPGRRMRDAPRRVLSYECTVRADWRRHVCGVYQTFGDST